MTALVAVVALLVTATPAGAIPPSEVQKMQWWISRLGLQDAWKITKGAGVTVAVIDSGVDSSFGDLKGALLPGFGVNGETGNGQQDHDDAKHGTRIADFIAGRGTGFGQLGVAPQAKILPVSYPDNGDTASNETAALTKLAALADPPDVVNMSSGAPVSCTPQLQQAVQAAVAKGMVLVASAGNDGPNGPTNTPANCVGVVAVGAYDNNLRAWSGSTRQPYVSLSGPGVQMVGYDSGGGPAGYIYSSGTSDSAAIVSGSFALLKAHFPAATPRELVTKMLYTARQFQGAQGTRNTTWGYGAARPRHALTDTVPANAPNPLFDALDKLTPTPSSSSATPGSSSPGASGSSSTIPVTAPSEDSSSNGLLIGIIVAVVVIALIVVFLVVRSRRRPARAGAGAPPPGGPPGYGP